MNENDTKLKVDALKWRVELPVASKAALRVRFSSFSLSLSLVRACVRVFAFILFRSLALLPREHFP
jgi:hypothetical protein